MSMAGMVARGRWWEAGCPYVLVQKDAGMKRCTASNSGEVITAMTHMDGPGNVSPVHMALLIISSHLKDLQEAKV